MNIKPVAFGAGHEGAGSRENSGGGGGYGNPKVPGAGRIQFLTTKCKPFRSSQKMRRSVQTSGSG
jgi:hypothetical protein